MHDDDDGRAQGRVRHAYGCDLDHASDGEDHFFDFGGTDAITGYLDHVIEAADEIEIAFRIPAHGIAGPDGDFGYGTRQRLETLGRFFRVAPVTLCDQEAFMNQFARLIHIAQ